MRVGPYDRNDGFSPGSRDRVTLPGLDNAARSPAPARPASDMGARCAERQPIAMIDEAHRTAGS